MKEIEKKMGEASHLKEVKFSLDIPIFQIRHSGIPVWCDESELKYPYKTTFFSLNICKGYKSHQSCLWMGSVYRQNIVYMYTQRDITVMWGTTLNMLFSSVPNLAQATGGFSHLAKQCKWQFILMNWCCGRHDVHDTNAPHDLCVAIRLHTADG